MTSVSFLPSFVCVCLGVCLGVSGCWGQGWWVGGGDVCPRRFLCVGPELRLSWISPVGDATACVLRPQIARWFSVGLLSGLVVHSWGWLGSLSTLSAAQTSPQLHAPQQFGVAHLKIEAPNPARWGGQGSFSVGRRPLRPRGSPACPAQASLSRSSSQVSPQARRSSAGCELSPGEEVMFRCPACVSRLTFSPGPGKFSLKIPMDTLLFFFFPTPI